MNDNEFSLISEIGPRGLTQINSANRGPVRKWLVLMGVDSPKARTLTNGQLDACYNDTSDSLLADLLNGKVQQEVSPAPEPVPAVVIKAEPKPVQTADSQQVALAGQLAGLIAQLTARAELDPEQVREIVQEEIAKQAPRVLEIRSPGGIHRLEGRQHSAFPALLAMLGAGINVWLVGPAGSGKTTMAEHAAKALGRPFYSTGAVSSDFRLMGFLTATGEVVRTPFREAFEHGGVFLWDEIDASNPNALVAFNQALANGHFAFPDRMVTKHPDFVAIGAANTYGSGATAEYVGRVRQDAAALDRFAYLPIDYDEELEREMVGPEFAGWVKRVQSYRAAAAKLGIKVVISPRASVNGARMISAGVPEAVVVQSVLRKNLDEPTWLKLVGAV